MSGTILCDNICRPISDLMDCTNIWPVSCNLPTPDLQTDTLQFFDKPNVTQSGNSLIHSLTHRHRCSSHCSVWMFINMVRLALVTSVTYLPPSGPPVKFYTTTDNPVALQYPTQLTVPVHISHIHTRILHDILCSNLCCIFTVQCTSKNFKHCSTFAHC